MTTRIGINGFGRIGRNVLRVIKAQGRDVEIVAINDLAVVDDIAMLIKYDTILGAYPGTVEADGQNLIVDGKAITVTQHRDPAEIDWAGAGADIVLECTGLFTNGEKAKAHLAGGAKKVIISAPGKNVDGTFVLGVNEGTYDPETMNVISNASCTTNCLAPLAKVINDEFGVVEGLMTTVHAYTGDQNLHDNVHKGDKRRARAAAQNTIPTSTGAAKAIGEVLPELAGKLNGSALRVPVITGSITDLTVTVTKPVTVEAVNAAYAKAAAEGQLSAYIKYNEDPIVSSDIVGDSHSMIFDAPLTQVIGQQVKVFGWYDNEWGYTSRLVDIAAFVGEKL
ncbi:MAG: type I glyceraldehyde-3-phosphate dehydrogenase [Arthrobacter sp.]|nr:type I glyceraldehyde-3-phosphate dehydrogenase [Arthrobacter sp.]